MHIILRRAELHTLKLSLNFEIFQVFLFPPSELNVSRIETKGKVRARTLGWPMPGKGCPPSRLDWYRGPSGRER